jgi:hypothetical protein
MRRHVDGDPGNRGREISAVIEIEASQVILVGLALALCWLVISPGTVSRTSPARMDRPGRIPLV